MPQQTEEERQRKTQVWIKKISTLEYHTLQLCEKVMTAYEQELAACERELDHCRVPLSVPHSIGYDLAHDTVITLQILAGCKPAYRNQQKPRTLEEALRSVGIKDDVIHTEQQRCHDYLQKMETLMHKSQELADRNVQITYDVLTAKLNGGATLTPEEHKAYEWSLDVFAANH